jgi:hypothetical protein
MCRSAYDELQDAKKNWKIPRSSIAKSATLLSLKDSSRNGIMDNFSYLAEAAVEKNNRLVGKNLKAYDTPDLAYDFQAAIEYFDGGDNKWRDLAEFGKSGGEGHSFLPARHYAETLGLSGRLSTTAG